MRFSIPLLLALATSCGSSTTTYVGTIVNQDVSVGVATDGAHYSVFFCGGPSSFATSTKWLHATGASDVFEASQDNWHVSATVNGETMSGTVDRGDGVKVAWSATQVFGDTPAGLYESTTESGTAGVVVLSATDTAGTHGALIDAQQIEPITPVLPFDLEPQGLHVQIAGADAFIPRATAQ